jgi:hypothetical protein
MGRSLLQDIYAAGRHFCAAFMEAVVSFSQSFTRRKMSLSTVIPVSLGQLASFVAGSALGSVLTLLRQVHREVPEVVLAAGSGNATLAKGQRPSLDDGSRSSPIDIARAAPAKRMRVGRLRLPQRVADLTPEDEPGLAEVDVFVDRLAELPIDVWLDIGRSLLGDSSTVGQRETAFAIVEATIGTYGLGLAAWYTQDAVETSAFVASKSVPRWTSEDRCIFTAAHAAAEDAALAVLARDKLATRDFDLLVAPLASLTV